MNGVDNMLYMQSTNANDGTMQLTVTFDVDTMPNIDQVNVQNRMAQAQPNLPPEVNQFGLTMRKSTGLPMLVVSLYSPKQHLRRAVPRQLRQHQHHRRALPRARRRRGRASSAPATTRCASGSSPIALAQARARRCPTSRSAVQQQSTVNPAGQVGGAAGAGGPGDDLHRPRAGTAADAGGVRRDRRALESGRLGRAAEGRRAHRARRAQLPADRPRQRPARRASSPSSRRPGSNALAVADGRQEGDGGAAATAFPPTSTTRYTLDTTLPVSEGHPRDPDHARRGDGARHLRRLSLPAELARDADPDDCRAGVADRHVRRLSRCSASRSTRCRCSASCSPSASSSTMRSSSSKRWSITSRRAWRRGTRRSRRWRKCRARSSASR